MNKIPSIKHQDIFLFIYKLFNFYSMIRNKTDFHFAESLKKTTFTINFLKKSCLSPLSSIFLSQKGHFHTVSSSFYSIILQFHWINLELIPPTSDPISFISRKKKIKKVSSISFRVVLWVEVEKARKADKKFFAPAFFWYLKVENPPRHHKKVSVSLISKEIN